MNSDQQEEHTREEVATMIMEADEQKLEEKEPKPEHVEVDEAMTEDDFRSDGTPSRSDESFDDLEKTQDEDDTLSGIYQEELEVSKLEPEREEPEQIETQESAPIDVDVAFVEEVDVERVPAVEEAFFCSILIAINYFMIFYNINNLTHTANITIICNSTDSVCCFYCL